MTPDHWTALLATVPATFRLARDPRRVWRLNRLASALEPDGTPRLVVQALLPPTPLEPLGVWWDLATITPAELPR